jgi:hypothetical protein
MRQQIIIPRQIIERLHEGLKKVTIRDVVRAGWRRSPIEQLKQPGLGNLEMPERKFVGRQAVIFVDLKPSNVATRRFLIGFSPRITSDYHIHRLHIIRTPRQRFKRGMLTLLEA